MAGMASQAQAAQSQLEQEVANLRALLQTEHDARLELERNTATAFRQQMPKITELERLVEQLRTQPGSAQPKNNMDLINLKAIQPDVFASKDGEAWKP